MQSIRIYTKPSCPYCTGAKQLLDELNLAYEDTDVEQNPDIRARLSAENDGYGTVPMIFIGSEFIGGFSELKAMHERGELMPRVASSPQGG